MKRFLLCLFFLTATCFTHATSISFAPLAFYGEKKSRDVEKIRTALVKQLALAFDWEAQIDFKAINTKALQSFLDAIRISNEKNLDYLIYGFIEEKEFSLYAELKLFDSREREVVQVFFSSDGVEMESRLVDDLGKKIEYFFVNYFSLEPLEENEILPDEGIISFALGGGYWTPFSLKWTDFLQSLYSACLRIYFIPWRPGSGEGLRDLYFKTGLSGNFYHSINQPGYEGCHLLNIDIGIPAYLCLDIGVRHTILLGLEPQFAMDYLIRERLHDEVLKTLSLLFSTAFSLEYQFHFTRHLSLSMENRFTFQFIKPVRITYNPALLFEINLNPLSDKK